METLTKAPAVVSAEDEACCEIEAMVGRARVAQAAIEDYAQEQADALVTAVGWQVYKSREALARLAVEEGGFGNVQDKIAKFANRVMGTLADMASIKTCGIVEEDPARGLVKIAKPVGVIAALIPTTGPDATPPVKALGALKARNAIIVAPHPRTRKTSAAVVEVMRKGCVQVGAPANLIQVIERPSIAKTELLMRISDLIVATGGAGMVKAAYSSGTPAYGVGVGNAVHVVDETADLDDPAQMIANAKTFDYATSCLADNSVTAHSSVYETLKGKLIERGGHVCTPAEKARLQAVMWPKGEHISSIEVVAKHAAQHCRIGRNRDRSGPHLPRGRGGGRRRGASIFGRKAVDGACPLSVPRGYRQCSRPRQPNYFISGRRSHLRHPQHLQRSRPGISPWHQNGARNGQPEHERRGRHRSQWAALYPFAVLRDLGREHHDGERQCPSFR